VLSKPYTTSFADLAGVEEDQFISINNALTYNIFADDDIIESGYNGVIVREKDVHEYVKRLAALMKDDERRRLMATNAVESSKQFVWDKIVAKWIELFHLRAPYIITQNV